MAEPASDDGSRAPSLVVSGLTFEYARQRRGSGHAPFRLSNCSFTATAGRVLAIVGPSGSGKSTILQLLSGKLTQASGQISVGDSDVSKAAFGERATATVDQMFALLPHLTVRENVEFALRAGKRRSRGSQPHTADRLLSDLEIDHVAEQLAVTLSGGEAQRATIARAIASHPAVLLLDEPTAGLDMLLRSSLERLIRRLRADFPRLIIVVVSHDRNFVISVADHVVVLDHGNTLATGPIGDLVAQPPSDRVAELVGGYLRIRGSIHEGEFLGEQVAASPNGFRTRIPCDIQLPGKSVTCLVPEHSLRLSSGTCNDTQSYVIGRFFEMRPRIGGGSCAIVDVAGGVRLSVTLPPSESSSSFELGCEVLVCFPVEAAWIVPR